MAVGPVQRLGESAGAALIDLATRDEGLRVIDAGVASETGVEEFRRKFPDRTHRPHETGVEAFRSALASARGGAHVFVTAHPASVLANYEGLVDGSIPEGARLRILAAPSPPAPGTGGPRGSGEDIAVLRSVPGLTIIVPPDGPTAAAAVRAAAELPGIGYLRFASEPLPAVSDGAFEIGRARTLRDGSDLTIVGVGSTVHVALDAAEELLKVGTSARVLDLVSVKPFDAKAILRAARETGALLALEEANAVSGVGSLVAATCSESEPVPVRRLGAPDLPPSGDPSAPWVTRDRVLEEAWELLRMRGKTQ